MPDSLTTYNNVESITWRRDGLIWRPVEVHYDKYANAAGGVEKGAAPTKPLPMCTRCKAEPRTSYNGRYCRPCRRDRSRERDLLRYWETRHPCADCGAKVSARAVRCSACANRVAWAARKGVAS